MRAAYLCLDRGVPIFGEKGCSLHAQGILRAMSKQLTQIDLHAASIGDGTSGSPENLVIHAVPMSREADRGQRELADNQHNDHFYRYLQKQPKVDFIYERYALWSYAAMEFAQEQGILGILEVNAPLIEEQRKFRGLIHQNAAYEASQRCFEAAHQLIAVSGQIKDYLGQFGVADKVTVVPNGVDFSRFEAKPDCGASGSKFVIGFIGTLKPWHGVDRLIRAFSRVIEAEPDTQLTIIGDGPERERLQQLASTLRIQNSVVFCGKMPPQQVPQALSDMDIGVAPYPSVEQGGQPFYFSPIKIFEYMAASLPVVATDIGDIASIVRHNKTGLLVDDEDNLFQALMQLRLSPEMAREMGQNGRQLAVEQYSWARRLEQIFAASGIQTRA